MRDPLWLRLVFRPAKQRMREGGIYKHSWAKDDHIWPACQGMWEMLWTSCTHISGYWAMCLLKRVTGEHTSIVSSHHLFSVPAWVLGMAKAPVFFYETNKIRNPNAYPFPWIRSVIKYHLKLNFDSTNLLNRNLPERILKNNHPREKWDWSMWDIELYWSTLKGKGIKSFWC